MKEPYKWNYNIKIKTKEGEFEYEDQLENLETVLGKHPDYDEMRATRIKPKTLEKKRGGINGRTTIKNN